MNVCLIGFLSSVATELMLFINLLSRCLQGMITCIICVFLQVVNDFLRKNLRRLICFGSYDVCEKCRASS